MNQKLYDLIEANPVIAAVKDMEGLDACCQRDEIKVVFILSLIHISRGCLDIPDRVGNGCKQLCTQ